MDHSMENPMWGSSSAIVDDENTLQNLILQMPTASNWSSPPLPPENLSNDVPPSPFSEFFLSRNFVQSVGDPLPIFDNVEHDDDDDDGEIRNSQTETVCKSGSTSTKSLSFSTPDHLHFATSTPSVKPSPPKISESNAAYYVSHSNAASSRSSSYFPPKKPISMSSRKSTNRNSDTVFSCDNCSFTATDRHTFMVHKRSRHYGEKSFSCNDCSAKFTRSYSLKKHVLQKHQGFTPSPQLPKYCPFPSCNFVTRNSNTMQIHKRSHQNASVYFCKQCNTRYVRRQSLLHHLTHKHSSNAALIGMKKIGQVNLNNSVSLDDDARSHENRLDSKSVQKTTENNKILVETRSKDVEKLYNCDKCQFTSKNFLDVYRHKQSAQHVIDDEKTLINKNICLYCHKKFASSNNLLSHIKKQHLESMKKNINETKKMFFCSKCSFSTTRKKVLKAHEDNSHVIMEQQQQQPNICFTLTTTPIRRSPPKSDRNSVQSFSQSDGAFVNYGNKTVPTTNQNLNLPIDLPNDANCFNAAACSSYCSFSTSSSSVHDPSLIVNGGNGSSANTIVNGTSVPMLTAAAMSRNISNVSSANTDSFDEMASCVQHIQMANTHLLRLCRRRENELKNLRANVIELLKRIYPNNYQFFVQNGCFPLENVDQLVINAINDNLESLF